MSESWLCALLQPVRVGFVTDALCVFIIGGLPTLYKIGPELSFEQRMRREHELKGAQRI